MALINSIGGEQFLTLEGQTERFRRQIEVIQRRGIDGVSIWNMGIRGTPFTLRSKVDAPNKNLARSKYVGYTAMIGNGVYDLFWSSLFMATEGIQVAVLDVRPVDIRRILTSSGGINPPSLGWCECDWDLIAIDMSP